ncbi:DNA-binding transcriptional regulator, GntR family [Sulfitobacter marinus]|uniref:DNA-binding transcriptional regulator, GntR family n=1 Tax=Sulfitobacter marinus TaxID=394264 RepID=A0A1I6VUH7_9RHOB|nr:GntR family transcriptional regulator [Sulfitobacter marinus]SFT17372.1 DNA-binding transcriptional regulator, GntR family [Sulfitobacter marinus]
MTQPPIQKSVTEITAEKIREAIILGAFPLGTKLSEQKLADLYQVSRSPVREALVLLQIEGLVRVFPKRGSFVFLPDECVIRDLCEHRSILEVACFELAVRNNHAGLLIGMQNGISHMQEAIKDADTKHYSRGDLLFHRSVIAHSGNSSMIKSYETTIGPLMALRTHLFTISGISLERSMQEHTEMLEACTVRDVAKAQAICKQHIYHLTEHFHELQMIAAS